MLIRKFDDMSISFHNAIIDFNKLQGELRTHLVETQVEDASVLPTTLALWTTFEGSRWHVQRIHRLTYNITTHKGTSHPNHRGPILFSPSLLSLGNGITWVAEHQTKDLRSVFPKIPDLHISSNFVLPAEQSSLARAFPIRYRHQAIKSLVTLCTGGGGCRLTLQIKGHGYR